MSEIRDKVEAQITHSLYTISPDCLEERCRELAEEILSIPEIAIVDREAELPVYWQDERMPFKMHNLLREQGWVKEIKE